MDNNIVRLEQNDPTLLKLKFYHKYDIDIQRLHNALINNTYLEKLTFDQCAMAYYSNHTMFVDYIKANKSLKKIKLFYVSLYLCTNFDYLFECLKYYTSINELILEYNKISIDKLPKIVNMLTIKSSLKTLCLSGNKLCHNNGIKMLVDGLKTNTQLEKLYLANTNIDNAGCRVLAEYLEINRNLRVLDISGNQIFKNGILAITNILTTNNCLEELCVRHNYIGPKGARIIANFLKENMTLKFLDISHNYLDNVGAKEIAIGLIHNNYLKKLYMWRNKIKFRGAIAIADALRHNNSLKKLIISINKFRDRGMIEILDGLKYNCSLELLDFNMESYMPDNSVNEKFIEVLSTNYTLTDVTGIDFDYEKYDYLFSEEYRNLLKKCAHMKSSKRISSQ